MTIDMEEFEALKKKFYESFAKEYNITLREGDITTVADAAEESLEDNKTQTIQKNDTLVQGVATDDGDQNIAVKEEGESEITFESGNLPLLQNSLKALVRKPGLIARTFLPLVEKALIEELGSSSSYRRTNFNFNIALSNNQIVYDILAEYDVDLFIGTDIDRAAVEHDENYIKNTIAVIPGIRIKQVKIDTTRGTVSISVEI